MTYASRYFPGSSSLFTVGSWPNRSECSSLKSAPSSCAERGCIEKVNALPARRLVPLRLSFLALDPVNTKRYFLESIRRCASLRSSGTLWTSAMMIQQSNPEVTRLPRRCGFAVSSLNSSASRRSIYCFGECRFYPSGYSRPSRAEKEEIFLRRRLYQSGIHNSILHGIMELSGKISVSKSPMQMKLPQKNHLPGPNEITGGEPVEINAA